MDHNYIRDFHLVDRYVLGKLSDAELARFEEHFIDCADCIVELKIAQTFIENLRSSSLPNFHQTPATDRNTVETNSSRAEKRAARGYFKFTRGLLAPAAAIAIILIIGGVSISFYEIHNLRRDVLEAKNNSGQWQNK